MEKKVLIFTLVLLAIFLPGYIHIRKLSIKAKELQSQAEKLKQDNTKLLEETHRLNADPFYIEKVAREKYGLIKKNEIAYKIEP